MNVNTGDRIPFWYRPYDGALGLTVVANLTDQGGNVSPGSPFILTPNAAAIYTAMGPFMITSNFVVYYQVYTDNTLTSLNRRYVDSIEWIQPTPGGGTGGGGIVYIIPPLKAKVSQPKLKGKIIADPEVSASIKDLNFKGNVTSAKLKGIVIAVALEG